MKRWPLLANPRALWRFCKVRGAKWDCPPLRFARGRRGRRGVLLLVVLSLLVLFVLIGVTFVLVASQSRRMSRADSRAEQYGDDYRRQLDEVFAQVVRDTTNPNSVLQSHSLLNDIYGNDGLKMVAATGSPITANPIAGGQFVDLLVNGTTSAITTPTNPPVALIATPQPLFNCPLSLPQIQTPGYFNGCVLTMLDGPARHLSTRIVGWGYAGTTYTIRVMAIDGYTAAALGTTTFSVLINGRPFNGTGFGFDPTTGVLDLPDATTLVPLALLPNHKFTSAAGIGGADEDYDAADPQNFHLAYMPINPTGPTDIIPSYHRPDLASYMQATYVPAWTNAAGSLQRQVIMRPLGMAGIVVDHPDFSGSNPSVNLSTAFNPITGPWDVDNDGDGIADSVWIDIGMPVQTAPDGRRFKPLAAILCLDLDGRLNVNAHGSMAQLEPNYLTAPATIPAAVLPGGAMPTLIRGQGYGPPEINLGGVIFGFTLPNPNYAAFLGGNANYPGRYGERNRTANVATGYPNWTSGVSLPSLPPYPGTTGVNDPLSAIKQFEFPNPNAPSALSAYGTAADLAGRGFVALDVRGTPLTPYMGNTYDLIGNPYQLDLSRRAIRAAATSSTVSAYPLDGPFTAAELERILRLYDIDVSALPDRLRALLSTSALAPGVIARMVTTDSYDLPSPSILPTRDMRIFTPGIVSQHIVDLLKLRLTQALYSGGNVNAEIQKMLPPELVAGQRLDINRPFGNGLDDNGNGIVDEPGEAETAIWNSATSNVPTAFATIAPNYTNGIDVNLDTFVDAADSLLARQLYARHLYILMMLLIDQNTTFLIDGEGPDNATETARAVAQWAVNVVDFRDRDSIMTPFQYTIHPFLNGWTATGDLTATPNDTAVVWGCERPELLITETLAFHDRRTEDLATDSSPISQHVFNLPPIPLNKDPDFDQRLRPRGSLFVEIYNPWSTQTSTLVSATGNPSATESSGEFSTLDTTTNIASGVLLNQTNAAGTPVWRLLIVRGTAVLPNGQIKDPDDPIAANRPITSNTIAIPPAGDEIERSIYFANPGAITGHGQPYFTTLPVAPLLPGRYAIIGSAGQAGLNVVPSNKYVNTIGRLQTTSASGTTQDGVVANVRQIVLTPNANSSTPNQVQILNNGKTPTEPLFPDIQYTIAAVMNQTLDATGTPQPGSVSISEPVAGYTAANWNPLSAAGEGAYSPPFDTPLDISSPDAASLMSNVPVPRFRVIHLQRLANPTIVYNAQTNPYLTIDTMPVALFPFNGATNDPEPFVAAAAGLASIQRGDSDVAFANNLWRQERLVMPTEPPFPAAGNAHNFNFILQHSLGYLNTNYGVGASGTAYTSATAPATLSVYAGAPNVKDFPWLTWNNRPFIGPMELALVPRSRSSRLLYDYVPNLPGRPFGPVGTIYGPTPLTPVPATPPLPQGTGHLIDLFARPSATSANILQRIFEYVQVPSRFVGTETELSPAPTAFGAILPLPNEQSLISYFHPPFNKVSNYRDPGRVNINTIPSDDPAGTISTIWNAILDYNTISPPIPVPTPLWPQVSLSREGGAAPGTSPTRFANPFRSSGGGSLLLPGTPARTGDVDVTLLRPGDPPTSTDIPLFLYSTSLNQFDDPTRNPYFRYQYLQRLSNLLTTRSNVYAVWITVGYFEVTPVAISPVYPDGYQLGREVGSDSGEIKRHRAFYIYDRSIPVGFEPGRDHNFDKGVLVKRFIE